VEVEMGTATYAPITEIDAQESRMARDIFESLVSEDLSYVEHRIVTKLGYSPELAQKVSKGFKQFFALLASGIKAVPSEPIDDFWHTFLLYTRKYAPFCERFAGHFIHHEPFDQANPSIENLVRLPEAREIARQAFGELDEEVWGAACTICCGSACGGTGNN
jgi:hypothetical protein